MKGNPHWEKTRKEVAAKTGHAGFDAQNVRNSLQNLDLIDKKGITEFGEEVLKKWKNGEEVKTLLAKRILVGKNQWAFCYVLDIVENLKREAIWELYRGIFNRDEPSHLENVSHFNNFIRWLGVSSEDFKLSRDRFAELTGRGLGDVSRLGSLQDEIKLCLAALLVNRRPMENGEIISVVESRSGRRLNTHVMWQYAGQLVDLGLISYGHKGKATPKRGQHGLWTPTNKLDDLSTGQVESLVGLGMPPFLGEISKLSLGQLINQVRKVKSTHLKGVALEKLTYKMCLLLGMERINVRDRREGGIELDVTAEKSVPIYNSIQIQCKHTTSVGPSALAREVGNALIENRDVIMVVTTGRFTGTMRDYARATILRTGLKVILIDGSDLDDIAVSRKSLDDVMRRENELNQRIVRGDDPFWMDFIVSTATHEFEVIHRRRPKREELWSFLISEGYVRTMVNRQVFDSAFSSWKP